MENSDKPDHKQVEDDYSWHTSGNWKTKTDAATAFLKIIHPLDLFFPSKKQHGPLASLFAQQHFGTATFNQNTAFWELKFMCGETPILRISSHNGIKVGNQNTGKGLGAR